MEERQQELRELYQKAVEKMPESKTVVVFWCNSVPLSGQQRLKFEEAIDEITGGQDWQYTCNVWGNGYFSNLAIKPANINEKDLETILQRWSVIPTNITVEYRY